MMCVRKRSLWVGVHCFEYSRIPLFGEHLRRSDHLFGDQQSGKRRISGGLIFFVSIQKSE